MDNAESYYLALIVSLFALLCFSAFFSASEMAFSSLSRIKLKNLAAKNRRARLALSLLDKYDKLLSSVLIGNNIVNIASSALATVLFMRLFGAKGVSIATAVMTVLVLIFGEISPKTLAKESPELTALRAAPFLRLFMCVCAPLNYLATAWKRCIVRLFPPALDRAITEDELLTFVEEVRQEGGINKQEEEMIRKTIAFDDLTAGEICTPRADVAAVAETDTAEAIDRKFAETGFSRLPVYRESVDTITGVILLKDFHHAVMEGGKRPADIVKSVVFVTKTIKIARLLRTLQRKQSHLAVLVDEFGGTLGIVTIEDIVEELVGEIWDEHDEVIQPFRKNEDNTVTALAGANVRDMLAFIKGACGEAQSGRAEGPDEEKIPNATVGNWVLEHAGGQARAGEWFVWRNLRFQVTRVQRHRVMEVQVAVIEK